MLSLLVFNWVGYRLLISFMENKADLALERKIDNSEYDESSLIEITVPLNSPYLADYFSEFDRYVGELELDGVHYKYVKRKIVNGELVLFCLPNEERNDLQNSREEFFKLVNDLNHSQKQEKGSSSSVPNISIEYKKEHNDWLTLAFFPSPLKYSSFSFSFSTLCYLGVPERPPRV